MAASAAGACSCLLQINRSAASFASDQLSTIPCTLPLPSLLAPLSALLGVLCSGWGVVLSSAIALDIASGIRLLYQVQAL